MSIEEFKKGQVELARKIILEDGFSKIDTIAGVDQAFVNNRIISAVVVCDAERIEIIEKEYVIVNATFEYIPGLLCFREGPAIVDAFRKLKRKPDILLVEGHGIAHMRKFGLASYVGLTLDQPTIGIAKNLLDGEIIDETIRINREIRGYELKTKEGCKPIYISPGHRISLKFSLEIAKKCLRKHKLPEPLFLAHRYANEVRDKYR